jgi:hypothetical protein
MQFSVKYMKYFLDQHVQHVLKDISGKWVTTLPLDLANHALLDALFAVTTQFQVVPHALLTTTKIAQQWYPISMTSGLLFLYDNNYPMFILCYHYFV